MNSNTGQLYPTREAAIAALGPTETAADIVEIAGAPAAVQRVSRAVQKQRAVERRRAQAKRARAARRHGRR